jgi:hypothetical protein
LDCDLKETQTNHVRSKLSEILKVYFENLFPEKYHNNRNIGPFKYWFRLSTFQINYSIDDINYRTALDRDKTQYQHSATLAFSFCRRPDSEGLGRHI